MNIVNVDLDWCIWHEGVSLFDMSVPGSFRPEEQFRNECIIVQNHNPAAAAQIQAIPPQTLRALMSDANARIPGERSLHANFHWVLYHEGYAPDFRAWSNGGDFGKIRQAYYSAQAHNDNVKNLLAAISNGQLRQMIDTM
jgi:hypothetical protein